MQVFLLNAAVALVAIVIILGVWVGIHLLADKRLGERRRDCGAADCCHGTRHGEEGGCQSEEHKNTRS